MRQPVSRACGRTFDTNEVAVIMLLRVRLAQLLLYKNT